MMMNKRLKDISRVLPAAVTAMMLLFMTAAGAWAEETREPPTLLQIDNAETTGKQWAETLGFREPLKTLEVTQRYDSYIDLIND